MTTYEPSLSVLNAGLGDIKIVFNEHDDAEAQRAIAMLTDMKRRGYFIAVELPDGTYVRATEIDASRGRYILSLPSETELPVESEAEAKTCACGCGQAVTPGKTWVRGHATKGRKGTRRVGVPIRKARATGIARSAGG